MWQNAMEKRWGEPFNACALIPFGALVEHKPTNPDDIARLEPFGKKMLHGLFIGYAQRSGGSFADSYKLIDIEELSWYDHVTQVHVKRIPHKQVFALLDAKGNFQFPAVDDDFIQ